MNCHEFKYFISAILVEAKIATARIVARQRRAAYAAPHPTDDGAGRTMSDTGTYKKSPAKPNEPDGIAATPPRAVQYFPPARLLLKKLGVTPMELLRDKVTVEGAGLRRLIAGFARSFPFDAAWYARANPDVEGARLAGDITSLQEHFALAGYLEGRLPHALQFDPAWYHRFYKDISASFQADDVEGMRNHYEAGGFREGRAGCETQLPDAESWREG